MPTLLYQLQDFYFEPAHYQRILDQLFEQGAIHGVEIRLRRADETDFWVSASMQTLIHQGEEIILSALCDISDRKAAGEALRVAEENHRSIFENAIGGIYQSTLDGHFLRVNKALADMLGYPSPETMLEAVTAIRSQLYVEPACRRQFRQLLEEHGHVNRFEYQAYRNNGDIIWLVESARIVRDRSGKVLYYEGILEDQTQRKLEETALKREVEQLRIEIDQAKLTRQVTEITQSEYFQQLQANAEILRFKNANTAQNLPPSPPAKILTDCPSGSEV